MKLITLWPWNRFSEYELEVNRLKEQVVCLQSALDAERDASAKAKALVQKNTVHIRKLGEILAKAGAVSITLLLLAFNALAQPVVRNNVTTNNLAPSPADGWVLESASSIPQWSQNGTQITNVTAVGVNGGSGPSVFQLKDASGNVYVMSYGTNGGGWMMWSNSATGLYTYFTNGSGFFQGGLTAATITNTGLLSADATATDANGKLILATAILMSHIAQPGVIVTNGESQAITLSNILTMDATHYFLGSYMLPTNANNTGVFNVAQGGWRTNISGNITLGAFAGVPTTTVWSLYITVTNSDTSTHTVTMPNGVIGFGNGNPAVFYVTNATEAEIQVNGWGTIRTNVNFSAHY